MIDPCKLFYSDQGFYMVLKCVYAKKLNVCKHKCKDLQNKCNTFKPRVAKE